MIAFTEAEIADIRAHAWEAELRGALHAAHWDFIRERNLLNLYLPKNLNGLGYSLTDALKVLETLAFIDGALGWTVTLCSGAHWLLGFLDPKQRARLLQNEKLCVAGSGEAGGDGVTLEGGIWIKGEWLHATAAQEATVLTANCSVDDEPVSVWFYKEEVQLFNTWKTMGMKATGSNGFRSSGQLIPTNRVFRITPDAATHPDAIFQFPFELLALLTLVANITGMVKRFEEIIRDQEHYRLRSVNLNAAAEYEAMLLAWEAKYRLVADRAAGNDPVLISEMQTQGRQLVRKALELIHARYSTLPLQAAQEQEEINRIFRNLYTAARHPLIRSAS